VLTSHLIFKLYSSPPSELWPMTGKCKELYWIYMWKEYAGIWWWFLGESDALHGDNVHLSICLSVILYHWASQAMYSCRIWCRNSLQRGNWASLGFVRSGSVTVTFSVNEFLCVSTIFLDPFRGIWYRKSLRNAPERLWVSWLSAYWKTYLS
jgi:hypothetical protein